MARILLYDKETTSLKKAIFIDKSEITAEDLYSPVSKALDLDTEVKNLIEMSLRLAEKGLGLFIDSHFSLNENESDVDYGYGFAYEINIIPYSILGSTEVFRMQFITSDFDDEEVDRILEIVPIKEIYENDAKFRKLIEQVRLVDADWNAILNYLSNTYAFNFVFINYSNEENS